MGQAIPDVQCGCRSSPPPSNEHRSWQSTMLETCCTSWAPAVGEWSMMNALRALQSWHASKNHLAKSENTTLNDTCTFSASQPCHKAMPPETPKQLFSTREGARRGFPFDMAGNAPVYLEGCMHTLAGLVLPADHVIVRYKLVDQSTTALNSLGQQAVNARAIQSGQINLCVG